MPSIAPVSAQSRRFARLARVAVLVGCAIAVAGCNSAIETVRSVRGFTKNDPDPATAPFTGNLAVAEAAPYPNLASVPPPPTRATTTAERQKLTEKLVTERAAAQAAGSVPGGVPGGVPGAAQPVATEAAPAAPSKPPPIPAPAAMPQPVAATAASPAAGSGPSPASALPATAPTRAAAVGASPGPRRAASGEPAEPLPRDSEVRMPEVRSRPEPDEPRPAPATPHLPPVPAPAPTQLPPAAIASATPQPPLPIPQLVPIAPPGPSLAGPDLPKTAPPRLSGPTTVAMLDAPDPGQLDPAQITQIAARYKESLASPPPPRIVRVIAYTARPEPGADPLGGYHDALARAQGVAKVLTEAGIPEKTIQTEAKPAAGPLGASRVEIQFLP